MQRVAGTVVSVTGDTVTVKAEDGTVYQVTTTVNTRVVKGQGTTVKVADLKAGDGAMALGNMDAPEQDAACGDGDAVTDAETLKKMRENLGKTYIAGRVTAIDIDNLKMTAGCGRMECRRQSGSMRRRRSSVAGGWVAEAWRADRRESGPRDCSQLQLKAARALRWPTSRLATMLPGPDR